MRLLVVGYSRRRPGLVRVGIWGAKMALGQFYLQKQLLTEEQKGERQGPCNKNDDLSEIREYQQREVLSLL
jgi:hypothetical protein